MTALAYPTSAAQLGVAVEVTRNTAVAPAYWVPYMDPDYTPNQAEIEDKGMRGSPVDVYDLIPGQRYDELGWKGNPFLDSFPVFLRGLLGSADTTVAAPSNTTLAALAAAGASSVSTTASIASGSWIVIGAGAALETHKTSGVSGAGPYSVTLATPLVNAQSNGAAVTGLTGHKIGLLANASQFQPPSLTLTDFDGEEWRQIAGAQMDTLNVKFDAAGLLEYTTKSLGNPSTTPSTPSPSNTSDAPPPGWTVIASVGGSAITYVESGEINMKRGTKPIPGLTGTKQPYLLFAGPLSCTGKLTVIEQSGSPELAAYLAGTQTSLDFTWYELTTGHALNMHLSQVKYRTGKVNRGKDWTTVELEWRGRPNATDAIAGGLSPILTTTANAQAGAY